MKTRTRSKAASLILATLSFFATASAFADYHLTAFSDTVGFRALIAEDIATVKGTFATRKLSNMDYFEANNLCVAQILMEDFDSAIGSCSDALQKAEFSYELTFEDGRIALAAIYSNLAVAKAMGGDSEGASSDLKVALSLNEDDDNASLNYDLLSTNLIAGN